MSTTQADGENPEVIETPEDTGADSSVETPANDEADDEVIVSIGEPPPPKDEAEEDEQPPDREWLKKLRLHEREQAKRIRELEAKNAALSTPAPVAKPALRPKPDPADFGFVDEKYEPELLKWHDEKRAHDKAEADEKARAQAELDAWVLKHKAYKAKGSTLRVPSDSISFDEAESVVTRHLTIRQQELLIDAAEDPAVLVYALGSNPDEAKRLGALKDGPFAVALGRLESKVKVTTKKPLTIAEKPIGSRAPAASTDNTLARLEAEFEKDPNGDRSKINAYKAEQARKKQGK